jgi:hypothetical protein
MKQPTLGRVLRGGTGLRQLVAFLEMLWGSRGALWRKRLPGTTITLQVRGAPRTEQSR